MWIQPALGRWLERTSRARRADGVSRWWACVSAFTTLNVIRVEQFFRFFDSVGAAEQAFGT
jgi:hypothetical protein